MARNGKIAIGLALATVVAMVFFPVVVDAVNTSTGTQNVTNETVTANSGEYVDLGGYQINENSETVYGYNDTSDSWEEATAGSDYEMSNENGSIKALSGSSLIDDGEDMRVSYTYEATGSTTTLLVGFIPMMIGVLVFAKLARGATRQL